MSVSVGFLQSWQYSSNFPELRLRTGMAHYWMKAGGKWQAEAASWDRGLVC